MLGLLLAAILSFPYGDTPADFLKTVQVLATVGGLTCPGGEVTVMSGHMVNGAPITVVDLDETPLAVVKVGTGQSWLIAFPADGKAPWALSVPLEADLEARPICDIVHWAISRAKGERA